MITFTDLLHEAKVHDIMQFKTRHVEVYRVLTRTSLSALIQQHQNIRAIWKDGHLFCWDGFEAVHADFEDRYGKGAVNLEINREHGQTTVEVSKGKVTDSRLKAILHDLPIEQAVWS